MPQVAVAPLERVAAKAAKAPLGLVAVAPLPMPQLAVAPLPMLRCGWLPKLPRLEGLVVAAKAAVLGLCGVLGPGVLEMIL